MLKGKNQLVSKLSNELLSNIINIISNVYYVLYIVVIFFGKFKSDYSTIKTFY